MEYRRGTVVDKCHWVFKQAYNADVKKISKTERRHLRQRTIHAGVYAWGTAFERSLVNENE